MRRSAQASACWSALSARMVKLLPGSRDELHAAVTAGQAQHGDLVPGGITGTGHAQFQHCRRAILARDLGDERFRSVFVRTADNDGPVALEAGDEAR